MDLLANPAAVDPGTKPAGVDHLQPVEAPMSQGASDRSLAEAHDAEAHGNGHDPVGRPAAGGCRAAWQAVDPPRFPQPHDLAIRQHRPQRLRPAGRGDCGPASWQPRLQRSSPEAQLPAAAAGQSFGAFLHAGHGPCVLEGEANDYVGKGMNSGSISLVIVPPRTAAVRILATR